MTNPTMSYREVQAAADNESLSSFYRDSLSRLLYWIASAM
jgi:hypothetical protein